MPQIYAGAAKRTITPDLDQRTVFLAGFQENRPATAVHDDLYVRVMAVRLEDKTQPPDQPEYVALAICDLIGLGHADVQHIRQLAQKQGLDTRGLIVACTHTHSGPDTIGLWGKSRFVSGVDPAYKHFVFSQVVSALAEAVSALAPAQLRAGQAEMPRWLKNARQPHIVDRTLGVLQATSIDSEQTIFTLVNLPCHPEVMFGENRAITADYAGTVCQTIEARQGGVGLFASADVGGMMTPDVPEDERRFETVQAMGEDIAAFALDALKKGDPLSPPAICLRRRDVRIPLDNPLFKFARATGVLPRLPLDDQGRLLTQVSLLDLGSARMLTIPGELFPRLGLRLRDIANVPYCFLIGLADDELGYILPSDEFVFPGNPLQPQAHYEETMSVSQYAAPLLMEAWVSLLAD